MHLEKGVVGRDDIDPSIASVLERSCKNHSEPSHSGNHPMPRVQAVTSDDKPWQCNALCQRHSRSGFGLL